jgi:hypothetical protein
MNKKSAKRFVRQTLLQFASLVLLALLAVLVIVVVARYWPQARVALLPAIPTATQAPVPAPSTPIAYSDALKTYENVATAAIETSRDTVDMVRWVIITFIVGSIGAAVSMAKLLLINVDGARNAARDAKSSAEHAQSSAEHAQSVVEGVRTQTQADIADVRSQFRTLFAEFIKAKGSNLAAALYAGDAKQADEALQFMYVRQWRLEDKLDAYKALKACAADKGGLHPNVRLVLELELKAVQQRTKDPGKRPYAEKEDEQRLSELLAIKPT